MRGGLCGSMLARCFFDIVDFLRGGVCGTLFLLALLLVFQFFLTLSTVVFNCACNLIEEHGLILLFEIVYEHS
jgi:hypothetical protein